MEATMARVVGPGDGKAGVLGSSGFRFMIDGAEADDRFSLVEHPMSPRALAAPLHRHSNEDEYSFVLEGRVGMQLGEDTLVAGPGELVFKPRGQWHAFWNAGDEPARMLEIISPAGFERRAPPPRHSADTRTLRNVPVVNTSEQASHHGELVHAVEAGVLGRDDVAQLGDVLTGTAEGRGSDSDITVFDSTGLAIQDLAIALAAMGSGNELDLQMVEL